jgi:hypothetical protein
LSVSVHHGRQDVRPDQWLFAQGLPDGQHGDPGITGPGQEQQPDPGALEQPAGEPGERPRQQRQHLQGVQPDEVADPQVAADRAPADHGQTRSTVRGTDGVLVRASHRRGHEQPEQGDPTPSPRPVRTTRSGMRARRTATAISRCATNSTMTKADHSAGRLRFGSSDNVQASA